ncbi:MAG: hypothetical protein PVS3B1_13530 [Ktedonobacteraceae bacterium]
MHIVDIQLLFDYYYWATAQILNATEMVSNEQFTRVRPYGQRSLRAMSSERNWRTRWQGNATLPDLDEQKFPTLAALQTYWKQQALEMRTFLHSVQEEDLTRIIEGTTDEGTVYADPVWHSMLHVLFHGSQHRSEAAEFVTEYGFSPGELYFFVFFSPLILVQRYINGSIILNRLSPGIILHYK